MSQSEEKKTVVQLDGAVRFDPIFQSYIVRIPEQSFSSSDAVVSVQIDDAKETLEYNAEKKHYFKNFLKATSIEAVENAPVIVE